MSDFDINFPQWVDYGNSDKDNKIGEKMDELTSQNWSPFNGYDYAKVFIFCMSYTFAKGKKPIPPPKRKGSMPSSAFDKNMRDFMKVVAIAHTRDLNIITKPNDVVRICEDYAYASFLDVYNTIKNRDLKISNEIILDSFLQNIEQKHTDN